MRMSIVVATVRRESRARAQPVEIAQPPAPTQIRRRTTAMRFIMMVKASKDSEAGVLPDEKILAEMGKYNEEMVKAGVMLAGEGLQASSKGARVRFTRRKPTVTDGPFSEAKELVAGFWLIQVKSKEEAIEWAKRAPFDEGEIEIRQVFELEDFGSNEAVEQHARIRDQLKKSSSA
jgi:hypothetical protein